MSNNQTKNQAAKCKGDCWSQCPECRASTADDQNQAATGMSIDTPEFRDALRVYAENHGQTGEDAARHEVVQIVDEALADLRAQLAHKGQGEPVGEVRNDIERVSVVWFGERPPHGTALYLAAPASAQLAEDDVLALHRQLAAAKLRADQGWQRAEAKSRECIELRERMASAQPDRGAAPCEHKRQATTAFGAVTNTGWKCRDCGKLLSDADAPDRGTPHSQPVRGVPDGWAKAMRDLVRVLRGVECGDDGQWKFIANVCENAEELLATQPVAPAQGAQVGGPTQCQKCGATRLETHMDDHMRIVHGAEIELDDEQPHSTATEGADGMGGTAHG